MLNLAKDRKLVLLFFLLSLFLFTRSLDVHGLEFRDDEIFYFNSTQQMVEIGEYMSPVYFDENRFQKPILFYWIIIVLYKIFGMNWVGARIVSSIFASFTVVCTWILARRMFDRKTASLSSLILMTTVMFFRHAKSAVPDMTLNFFIVGSLLCAYLLFEKIFTGKESEHGISATTLSTYFFVSCAMGFMIKGFAAWIVPMLTVLVYALIIKRPGSLKSFKFLRGWGIILVIVLPWFVYMVSRFGSTYVEYMLIDETKNRLVGLESGNIILNRIKMFLENTLFYLNTILSYFAPWSIFGLLAIPYSMVQTRANGEYKRPIQFLIIWFFVVFLFFSIMDFTINHYILVLTTPFAILTSNMFVNEDLRLGVTGKILYFVKKYIPLFLMIIGAVAFNFMLIFLLGANPSWVLIISLVMIFAIYKAVKSPAPYLSAFILGVFLFVIFSQSSMMDKARITSHSTLQRFAETINKVKNEGAIVTVGSRDIHEKEFQVYFDQKILKTVGWNDEITLKKLTEIFKNNQNDIFCLITRQDFVKYFENNKSLEIKVIKTDRIFRKRMFIDREFFKALIRLDQETVKEYLMEEVILIKKKAYV